MEKIFLKFMVVAVFTIILLTSCTKENHEPASGTKSDSTSAITLRKSDVPNNLKVEEVFLAGNCFKEWMYTKQIINGQVVPLASCDMDNIPTFYKNGIYIEYDGPTSCDSVNTGVAGRGTWNFTANGKYFYLNDTDLVGNLLILKLTPDTLGVEFPYPGLGTVQLWMHARHKK